MNIFPRDKQIEAISALCEGVSIRATARLTGVHRDTIMRLGVRVGMGCAVLHDQLMRDLRVNRIELDEAWSYVGKKQRQVKPKDGPSIGDQYVFLALADSAKAVASYRVGKRDSDNTRAFVADLRERVLGAAEISSDAFQMYPPAVELAFGIDVHYGQIEKHYKYEPAKEAARRYSPCFVVSVSKTRVVGRPARISTSCIERQNLTLRMQQRLVHQVGQCFQQEAREPCGGGGSVRCAL